MPLCLGEERNPSIRLGRPGQCGAGHLRHGETAVAVVLKEARTSAGKTRIVLKTGLFFFFLLLSRSTRLMTTVSWKGTGLETTQPGPARLFGAEVWKS